MKVSCVASTVRTVYVLAAAVKFVTKLGSKAVQ